MSNLAKLRRTVIAVLLCFSALACRLPFLHPPPLPESLTPSPSATVSPLLGIAAVSATPLPHLTSTLSPGTDTPTLTLVPASREDRERYNSIFRFVWRRVNRRYVYPSFNGVDCDAVREEYEPLVAFAADDEHFWQLMREMVGRLDDDHSAFLSPAEVAEEDQAMSGDLDYVGIGVYVTVPEDVEYAVVLFPMSGGPAEAAGIRAHDRILEIVGLQVCCDAEGFDNLDAMLGPEGSPVSLLLQYPGERERLVTVERSHIQTQLPILSRPITLTVHNGQTVGYIMVPTLWDDTISERTREVLADVLEVPDMAGLVVDMRINGGGAYTELYDLLSLFTAGEVGAFYQREGPVGTLDIVPDPVAGSQNMPMVVLIGPETESYAEVFSGVLQAQNRAILVGEPTAGNVETVYPYDLEDGSRLWLAEETFAVPGTEGWEHTGVQPDITGPGRWEEITEEDDPALNTAVTLLLSGE
jgi:carboxyl-terminal processing protease